MKYFKKIFAVVLTLMMILSFASCKKEPVSEGTEYENAPTAEPAQVSDPDRGENKIKIAATEFDFVFRKLSLDRSYAYDVAVKDVTSAKAADMLVKNQISIASLAVNDVATVAAQTDIKILAVTSELKVSLITKGGSTKDIDALRGKTVYCGGKDTFVQTVVEKIFDDNGIRAELVFLSDSEVASMIKNGESDLFVLQEPEGLGAVGQNGEYVRAFELTGYWKGEYAPVSRCIVARADFANANPELIKEFVTHIETCANSLATESGAMYSAMDFVENGLFVGTEATLGAISSTKFAFYEKDALKDVMTANFGYAKAETSAVSDGVYYKG